MTRKSLFLALGILVLVVALVAGTLLMLVRREPEWFRRVARMPPETKAVRSHEFETRLSELHSSLQGDQPWQQTFTDEQINGYLEKGFLESHIDEVFLPEGVSTPRVAIDADKIRLAFRYGKGAWSTVISVDLRLWLAAQEPNVVVVELESLHAGALPITAQSLLEKISEAAQRQDIKVTWYRHEGNPTAVLRFHADKDRPTVQLKWLELQQGKLTLGGCSQESNPVRAMLTPTALRPNAN